jgi:hypothetical protein
VLDRHLSVCAQTDAGSEIGFEVLTYFFSRFCNTIFAIIVYTKTICLEMKYYHFFVASVYFLLFHSISSFGQSNFVAAEEELAYHADVMANASEGRHRSKAMSKFNSICFLQTLGPKKDPYQHAV